MVRRSVKKPSPEARKPALNTAALSQKQGPASPRFKGVSFGKFLVLILIVLGVLYGPSFLKNGIQTKPSDFRLRKVAQFKVNPSPEKTFFATDLAGISTDELAVTDQPGNQVLIYDFQGKLIRKWGSDPKGKDPRSLKEPSGITTDRNGNLYVLDTWNGAVKVFNIKGELEKVLDLSHLGFYGPRWIGWGGNSLLIPNGTNFSLVRLSLTGDLLNQWQGKDGVGSVACALGDGKGHYYAGGTVGDKAYVQVLDESGKILRKFKMEGAPLSMALDNSGRLFVGCYGNPAKVFDANGKLLGNLTDEAEVGKPIYFSGIDITPDGTILTCIGDSATIYKVSGEK